MINNKKFVNKIIAQGKEIIDDGANILRYMKLAEEL